MIESRYQHQALADFLRTRRARLSPEEVGLPGGGRRRTSGLRREEVSSLANVGISWYTALEQGRDVRPSEEILHSLADVLRLTPDERQHLFWLAGYSLILDLTEEEISPALKQILAALEPNPAYILGLCWSYLAWNESADRLFSITASSGHHVGNLLWQLFMNPDRRQFFIHWDKVTQNVVAEFRAEAARYPQHAYLCQLIKDLKEASPDFRQLWERHNIQTSVIRRKEILHERVGRLSFDHTPLFLAEHPTLKMIVYTPCSESAQKMQILTGVSKETEVLQPLSV
jgi:transcriptional regulator with XRE-family HTH domain